MVPVEQFGNVGLRHSGHHGHRCLAQRELGNEGAHVLDTRLFPAAHELKKTHKNICRKKCLEIPHKVKNGENLNYFKKCREIAKKCRGFNLIKCANAII
jgi:hypothetical protein